MKARARIVLVLPVVLVFGFALLGRGVAGTPDFPLAQGAQRGAIPVQDAGTQEQAGPYYALVIGINDYRNLPKLATAVKDAQAIEAILRNDYGFKTELLLNATRDEIMDALFRYRSLDERANLLIYYAGHGRDDKQADKAYWQPVDAEINGNARWISADDITGQVKAIPARHVLIVSDSCYSGGLNRSASELYLPTPQDVQGYERFLDRMMRGYSRSLLSSGGVEPVSDSGGGGHSVFAAALIRGLTERAEMGNKFGAQKLFQKYIYESVASSSRQTPKYEGIHNSGREDSVGDFVFVRQSAGQAAASEKTAATPKGSSRESIRSVPEAPPARTNPPPPPSREGAAIAGCWQGVGMTLMTIRANGTFVSADQNGQWEQVDAVQRLYKMYWPDAQFNAVMTSDARTLNLTGYWGASPVARISPGTDFVASWRWPGGVILTILPDGTFTNVLTGGTWRLISAQRRAYLLTFPGFIHTMTLSANNQELSGTDQYGTPVKTIRTQGCPEN